jgi:UDP-glucose:(heptosyl)LPS alpha-1,3-glucosyltransferase
VIHNGCDTGFFTPEERAQSRSKTVESYGLDAARPLLLFPGSDWVRKGLAQAVEVLSRIPEAQLLVAGRGNPKSWRRCADRAGVAERVVFAPPTHDLRSLYRAADVSLLPTWSDPFANVTLESIACGTPIVTTAYNGGCEVIEQGENGFVARNPADVADMAGGVKALLERRCEPGRAQALSESVANCTLERNRRETLAVIREAAQ